MSKEEIPGEFHTIVSKVYDSNGECIAITSSTVSGEFEPSEATKKYWDWLDGRRYQNEMD